METIPFSDWQKLDIRAGKILKVEEIAGADKLYKLGVDVGEEKPRTLAAGIKQYYKKEELQGKSCVVFCNLEPKIMRGVKSEGMILAAVNEDESKVVLIQPEKDAEPGMKIR
jgi:methionine--tRNA ligase beta chain